MLQEKRICHGKRKLDTEKEEKKNWPQYKPMGHGKSEWAAEKVNWPRKKIIGYGKNRISHRKNKIPVVIHLQYGSGINLAMPG